MAMTLAQQFREEGYKQGYQEGLWMGRIEVLEEFLGLPPSSSETLEALTVKELESIHSRLHTEYEERFKRP
jgi:flagellar biosynthesis/type III secretory pathway protein FliH